MNGYVWRLVMTRVIICHVRITRMGHSLSNALKFLNRRYGCFFVFYPRVRGEAI